LELEINTAFGDVIAFGMTLFVCAIIVVVGYAMFTATVAVPGDYSLNKTYTSPDGLTHIRPAYVGEQVFSALDWVMVFIMVVFAAGMFASGYMLPSHPVFVFISLFAIFIWLWISPFFSNVWLLISAIPVMTTAVAAFPLTTTIVMNLPLIGLVVGVIAGVATYGKSPGGAPF